MVVLLGQDRADQADDRVRSGKIPTTSVRRRISRLSRWLGLLDQICRQISLGNTVNASASAGPVEVLGDGREAVGRRVEDPVELLVAPTPRRAGRGRCAAAL